MGLLSLELLFGLASILLAGVVAVVAWKNWGKEACPQLFSTCMMVIIWDFCTWMESLPVFSGTEKLLWRCAMQVGVLYVVPAFFSYTLHYIGMYRKGAGRVLAGIYAVQTAVLLLILTNPLHHLIWGNVQDWAGGKFGLLVVPVTGLGMVGILFNFAVHMVSLVLLMQFALRSRGNMRRQAWCVFCGGAFFVGYALIHSVLFPSVSALPPIPYMFSFSALIGCFGMWRYHFISLVPNAYQEIFEVIDEGVIIALGDGDVISINRAMRDMFALHGNDTIQNDREGRKRAQRLIEERYPNWRGDGSGHHQFGVHLEQGGRSYYYHCRVYPFFNMAHRMIGSIAVIRDVTAEHEQTQILQEQAEKDGLTGVYNRQTFTRLAEQQLRQGERPWSVLYFDLDYFKQINDTYGHMFGDQVLCETCTCVAAVVGQETLFCRAGGEEFMVFLRGYTAERARLLAEAVRREVEGHVFALDGAAVPVTISVGVVTARTPAFDDYYRHADQMLYRAKSEGRNCVRAWSEDDGAGHGEEG